jgi:trehalose 6-phosphate synthase/phosphatase
VRLLIVSNRLPVVVSKKEGDYNLTKSAGGLVSGLSDFLKSIDKSKAEIDDFLWMGWPGMSIPKSDEDLIRKKVSKVFKASPVFFSQTLMDKVYLGFCNKTIWPLFHYFLNYTRFDEEFWKLYKKMNLIFRDELLKVIKPDDIIWVHDYHLMLLPALLREKVTNPIGFFLHIPFPAYEIYRTLQKEPQRELLEGLLGADLIGFHTHDCTQYFLRCVLRILGLENHLGKVTIQDRITEVSTFPMGIDYEKFHEMNVAPYRSKKPEKNQQKIVLSVDRLDYTKGILNRLKGFELFLKKNPEWREKVHLKMIVVPSRTGVHSYQKNKNKLDELVGKINGEFGTMNWVPIIYQYTSLPHKELIAQYRMSNVSLLTPLRDGMNLVAKEYIASLRDAKGVLILSEFTGAAKELSESIIINPNSIDVIADAIKDALSMTEEEQYRRNKAMQERLKRYTVSYWADDFVERLMSVYQESVTSSHSKKITSDIEEKLSKHFRQAKRKIVILNYDGVLIPLAKDHIGTTLSSELLDSLETISGDGDTDVFVSSGRSKEYLLKNLGGLPLNLFAEHCSWYKGKSDTDWTLLKPVIPEWKEDILPILQTFTDRLPGAAIEEKELSITWHYKKADIEQASHTAKELADNLMAIIQNMNIHLIHGNRAIELYQSGIDITEIAMNLLNTQNFDFILAIGNDWSDEFLFQTLPDSAYTFKVGRIYTEAKYMLKNQSEALKLLKQIAMNTTLK